jgi:hypothetical protein
VKLLLLAERFPAELLTGFEVVREPQDDVVAVLTMPRSSAYSRASVWSATSCVQ